MARLLLCFFFLCFCGSASLLSCDLAWIPIKTGATTNMTLGSYRVNMTFSGTVSIDGTVPTSDFSASMLVLGTLFSVSDSATGSNVTTAFRHLVAMTAAYSAQVELGLDATVFAGNSLLLEPPSYFKENVTYTFFYTQPLVSTTSELFVDGVAQSSFSCSVTMGRIPRMYHMTQITTDNFAASDYTQLVTPLFVFSEPVRTCGTGARFSSTNVKSYDGFAYSCPLWSYADGGRIWWCNTAEPGLEGTGNLWAMPSIGGYRFVFKPVQFIAVCTVNGNIPIIADDTFPRGPATSLDVANTANIHILRFRNVVVNLTSNAIEAVLPMRSFRGPINDSLSTRYYETGGFANDYEAQTFPPLNYSGLIGALKSTSAFTAGILSYRFTVAGPGYLNPSATDSDSVSKTAIPAIMSQASCWMEYSSDLARFATVCRFYTSSWIGQGIGIRLVTAQTPTIDSLAAGTLELDTSTQIYDNAYRTIRSNLTFLPSGTRTYLSHTSTFTSTNLFAFVRVINVTLLDSTPLTLSSVKYGATYTSLVFTFAGCNSELLGVSASRIVTSCTLGSTFTLVSSCVMEIPILDTTLCQMENISTLFDVAWTTQQVSPYSYSEVTVDKSDVYSDFPIQVVSAYLIGYTRLFVKLADLVSTDIAVNVSQLTLSCGTVTTGVFYPDESFVELTTSGCTESSTNLTVDGLAFTSATQSVFPVTLLAVFIPLVDVVPESSDCTLADVSIGYVLAISLAPVGGLVLLYGLARFFANSKLPFTGSQRRRRR